MKTLGVIGGMSWESTAEYYRLLNEGVATRLGGLNSAELLVRSVNFAPLEDLQHRGEWRAIGSELADAAVSLEKSGAEAILLATNTMHKVAPDIEQAITVPFIHIADALGRNLISAGVKSAGLLGTAFTMEQEFYTGRLRERFNIEILIPDKAERDFIHRVIYQELCMGVCSDESRRKFSGIIDGFRRRGAQGVILGCTEIPLLISQKDSILPIYDSSEIHCREALDFICGT
jgi:aspartate racemase